MVFGKIVITIIMIKTKNFFISFISLSNVAEILKINQLSSTTNWTLNGRNKEFVCTICWIDSFWLLSGYRNETMRTLERESEREKILFDARHSFVFFSAFGAINNEIRCHSCCALVQTIGIPNKIIWIFFSLLLSK